MPENRSFNDLPHPSEVQQAGGTVLSQSQNDQLGNIQTKKDLDKMVALRVAEHKSGEKRLNREYIPETDSTDFTMGEGIKTILTIVILGVSIYLAWVLMSNI